MVEWKAIYSDDNELQQYNEDGTENKYTDINRELLNKFVIIKDNKPLLVVHLDKNKRLIYRKRGAVSTNGVLEPVYLVGWQEKTNGKNIQQISFIFGDGHIEIVDRFYKNHRWFYPINFLPEESI